MPQSSILICSTDFYKLNNVLSSSLVNNETGNISISTFSDKISGHLQCPLLRKKKPSHLGLKLLGLRDMSRPRFPAVVTMYVASPSLKEDSE